MKAVLNKRQSLIKVCEKIAILKKNFVEDLTYFEKKNKIKIDIISDNKLVFDYEYIIRSKNLRIS